MSRVKIVTPKRKNPLGVATSKGAFHLVGLTVIVVPVKPLATATTAASGGNREELLGPRPAGCERQRSRRWEPQPGQWHAAGVTERFYHGPVLDSCNCRCKQKNHLNLKDSSGFLSMELLSRFELETSSLPRMRSTN